MGIYNIEATRANLRKMIQMCSGIYAAILLVFCVGISLHHSLYIREGLYLMLALFCLSVIYCIFMIIREMIRRKKLLETMVATDMLPYVRYSRASVIILWLAVLALPVAIFSTTLLYIVGPVVLFALLFFNLTFIALGNNYTPTEELLDKEEEISASVRTGHQKPSGEASLNKDKSCRTGTETLQQLSEERIDFIRQCLDEWCADLGYKDCAVNMLTLSRTLSISKEGCTPAEWREEQAATSTLS